MATIYTADDGESSMKDVLAVVLAGGKGSRLEPLTRDRAKPAVPFGGGYRIIDFTLSNCLNSGLRKMLVLTQYKAMSNVPSLKTASLTPNLSINPVLSVTVLNKIVVQYEFALMILATNGMTIRCI